jgi:hypothetical protein
LHAVTESTGAASPVTTDTADAEPVLRSSGSTPVRQYSGSDVVELSDAWAEREMKICVRELAALPAFAQELVRHLGKL